MSQDLTTRDVFEQIAARLSRVEDDLRSLRDEMREQLAALEARVDARFAALEARMDARMDAFDRRFDRLETMFVSVMIGIGGLVIAVGGLWLKQ